MTEFVMKKLEPLPDSKKPIDLPENYVMGPLHNLITPRLVELKLMIENILEQRASAQREK